MALDFLPDIAEQSTSFPKKFYNEISEKYIFVPVLPAGFPVFLSNIYCILQMGYIFKTDRSGFRLIP